MFNSLFNERVPEEQGDTLWNQCLEQLQKLSTMPVTVAEVNRLVVLVSMDARGDFQNSIQRVAGDVTNGFTDDLPF